MDYRYRLTPRLIAKARSFCEFKNGGAQATIKLSNGSVYKEALISNSTAIIALRGYSQHPFKIDAIVDIYQTPEDKSATNTDNWVYWDNWD